MQIISPRHTETTVEWHFEFARADTGDVCYSYPCDESGVIDEAALAPEGRETLAMCRSDADFVPAGVRRYEWNYRVPAVGKCDRCGDEVALEGFTNTCDRCGADYNMSGQLLAPREQWGWCGDFGDNEDGSPATLSDVLRIP